MSVGSILILAAVVVFALATAGVSAGVPLVPLGLALFAAGHLV
jgi:hypothetical protein